MLLAIQIGRSVRLRRRALGLSQQEFASKCGLSKTYIARLELASTKRPENPSLETVETLARSLGCAPLDLMTDRPAKKMLRGAQLRESKRLLVENVSHIRVEHVELLIELAQALRELAQEKHR